MAQARVVNMGRGPGRGPALEKPKNPKETIRRLAKYLMEYKGQMLLVVLGICGSSGASVASTYFLKPIILSRSSGGKIRICLRLFPCFA